MRQCSLEIYLVSLTGPGKCLNHEGWIVRASMTQEEAYEALKRETGEDFGYDVVGWKKYIKAHGGPKKYKRPPLGG